MSVAHVEVDIDSAVEALTLLRPGAYLCELSAASRTDTDGILRTRESRSLASLSLALSGVTKVHTTW